MHLCWSLPTSLRYQLAWTHCVVPLCAQSDFKPTGGLGASPCRIVPMQPGKFTEVFYKQLKEGCQGCAWWTDKRPVSPELAADSFLDESIQVRAWRGEGVRGAPWHVEQTPGVAAIMLLLRDLA